MFNERFKSIRQASGKTQKDLAEFLNISPQSVSKWEKGEALPSIEYLPLMAKFFGCSINVFFEDVYENTLPEKIDAQMQLSSDTSGIKDKIASAFLHLKLNVEITNIHEGIRIITFMCAAQGKTKLKHVFDKYKEICSLTDENIYMHGKIDEANTFVIEIAKQEFDKAPLVKAFESKEYKESTCQIPIVIGYDTNDDLVIDDFAELRHILIVGDVHSGKTTFLRGLLTCLTSRFTKDEIGLVVSDASKRDLLYANEYPHLIGQVLTNIDETEKAFKCLAEEMDARYAALEAYGVSDIEKYNEVSHSKMKRIVIVLDEPIDLLVYSDKISKMLSTFVMKGGAVGIHLVMATKYTHRKLESLKIYIPTVVALFTENTDITRSLTYMGICSSLAGCGDLIYYSKNHWHVRAQAPYIDEEKSLRLAKGNKAEA